MEVQPDEGEVEVDEAQGNDRSDKDILDGFSEYSWWWDNRLVCFFMPFIIVLMNFGYISHNDLQTGDGCMHSGENSVEGWTVEFLNRSPMTLKFYMNFSGLGNLFVRMGLATYFLLGDVAAYRWPSHNNFINAAVYSIFIYISTIIGPWWRHFADETFRAATPLAFPGSASFWYSEIFSYWQIYESQAMWFQVWELALLVVFFKPLKLVPVAFIVIYWNFSCPLFKQATVKELLMSIRYAIPVRQMVASSGAGVAMLTLVELFFYSIYFSIMIPLALKLDYFVTTRSMWLLRFLRIRDSAARLRAARANGSATSLNEDTMCLIAGKPPGHMYDEHPRDHLIRTRYPSIQYPNEDRVYDTVISGEESFARMFNRTAVLSLSSSLVVYFIMVKDLCYTLFHFGVKFDETINLLNIEVFHPTDAISFTGTVKWTFFLIDRIWLRPTAAPKELLGIRQRTIDVAMLSPAVREALENREPTEKKRTRSTKAASRLSIFGKRMGLRESMQINLGFNLERISIINIPPLFRKRKHTFKDVVKKTGVYKDPETGFWMSKVVEEVQFHNFRRFWTRSGYKLAVYFAGFVLPLFVAPILSNAPWWWVEGAYVFKKRLDPKPLIWCAFDFLEILVVFLVQWRCKNVRRYATDFGRLYPYLWVLFFVVYAYPADWIGWLQGWLSPMGATIEINCTIDPQSLWIWQPATMKDFSERLKFNSVYEYYDHLEKEGLPTPFPLAMYRWHPGDRYQYNQIHDRGRPTGQLTRGIPYDYPRVFSIPFISSKFWYPSKAEVEDPAMKEKIVAEWGEPAFNRMKIFFATKVSKYRYGLDSEDKWWQDFWDLTADKA